MRGWQRIFVGATVMLAASPVWAQGRYDPAYPFCMEAYDMNGSRFECFFTSFEQCKQGTYGTSGTCFKNPYYVAPPPEPEVAAATVEPPPPVKPAKPRSTRSAKSQHAPPAQPPAQTQVH